MNSFFTEFSFRLLRDGAGFTGTVNKLAFLSLALSTGVLFLVLSIVNGFEEELEESEYMGDDDAVDSIGKAPQCTFGIRWNRSE